MLTIAIRMCVYSHLIAGIAYRVVLAECGIVPCIKNRKTFSQAESVSCDVGIRIPYIAGTGTDILWASPGFIAAMCQIAGLVGRILAYSCVDESASREACQETFRKMLRDPLGSMGRSVIYERV